MRVRVTLQRYVGKLIQRRRRRFMFRIKQQAEKQREHVCRDMKNALYCFLSVQCMTPCSVDGHMYVLITLSGGI